MGVSFPLSTLIVNEATETFIAISGTVSGATAKPEPGHIQSGSQFYCDGPHLYPPQLVPPPQCRAMATRGVLKGIFFFC
jgi:hypothetical protein